MIRPAALLLLSGLAASAVEPPEAPVGRVTFGGTQDSFSDATGIWRDQFLTAEWFRDKHGPWSLSLSRSQRPEGIGRSVRISKEYGLDGASWVWGGVSAGSGADFVPRLRAEVDANLAGQGPWGIGAAGAWSRFGDGTNVTLAQAGPSWTGEVWSASLRGQLLSYGRGGSDAGVLADLRWGASSLHRWHSLRVAWGRGIIDSLQPGGGLTGGGGTGGSGRGRGAGQGGTVTTPTTTGTVPVSHAANELVAGTTMHLPLSRHLAVRAEAGWGRREGQFVVFSAGLQAVVTF